MASAATDVKRSRALLDPETLAGLANLELVARTVVEGFLIGLHRSPFFGFSQEFAEYRAYSEGDDPRFIDWGVYARTDRIYIKRFLGDTNSRLAILLDASASMGFGNGPVTKLRFSQFLAASLAYLASRQHDAVGTIVFDDGIRDYRPPSTRSGHLAGILHSIDAASPGAGTDLARPFEEFRRHITRRGLVVVISDFYCDPDALIEGVRPLAWQGQDVMLFQVLDPEEISPSIEANTLLEDPETGQAVEVDPAFMRDTYPGRMRAHIEAIKRAAAGVGADHQVLVTNKPLDDALRRYLRLRQRRN